MTESKNDGSEWILAWIEQQREQLRRAGMPGVGAEAEQVRDIGMRWLEAGQAYLQGWQQFAPQCAAAEPAEDPLKFGEEMLNAWQGAWGGAASAGAGVTRQFADLLWRLPALGLAREQTEAWRDLLAAQAEYQQLEQELRTVWAKVQADALSLLEALIHERRATQGAGGTVPGIEDYRKLYDLWVECGEKVFAQVAHSESYCKLQAQLGNAAIRLRARQQTVIERALKHFDLPTRSELNTVHRQMRELRERVASLEAQLAEVRGGERS